MKQEYNYRVLEKDSSKSWLRICYIDREDSMGLKILARDGIMHRIECSVPDVNSEFVGVYCTIPRSDLNTFKRSMTDLAEIVQAGNHTYYSYCEQYFEK